GRKRRKHGGAGSRRSDHGRELRHRADHARHPPPLPLPAGGPDGGGGEERLRHRREERLHQRAFLPGPLPGAPGDARRAHHRVHGPNGRRAGGGVARARSARQARLLHERRGREVPPPGRPRRPDARPRRAPAPARQHLEIPRRRQGGRQDRGRGHLLRHDPRPV
ncbi:MAG: 3-hydroxyacyl-[acyl-carrier-protein] dehydratase, FabZ form, partial [uncultured Acetobacteraceae bacterium]